MVELRQASKKLILVLSFLAISIVFMYWYIYLNTIDLKTEDIAKDIVKEELSR